jgi:hypothetical protein
MVLFCTPTAWGRVVFNISYDDSTDPDTLEAVVHIDSVKIGQDILGMSVSLKFDASVLAFTGDVSTKQGLINGWTSGHNALSNGDFLFSAAGLNSINSSGEVFRIKFAYLDSSRYSHWLTICSTQVNETQWIYYYPEVPELLAPGDDSTPVDGTPEFFWSYTAGPLGSYLLQCATDSTFDSNTIVFSTDTMSTIVDTFFVYQASERLPDGTYYWRVEAIDFLGRRSGFQTTPFSFTVQSLDVPEPPDLIPSQFILKQNYPNPFNPSTTIEFYLPHPSPAVFSIYNLLGETVKSVDLGLIAAGRHTIIWNGRDNNGRPVASGIYFYRLETSEGTQSRKMMLLK